MKQKIFFGLQAAAAIMLAAACAGITTQPLHYPIYPSGTQDVEYTVSVGASGGIKRIQLFETVSSITAAGVITAGTEALVQTWDVSGSPASHTVSYTKTGGYGSNKLVAYRFLVTDQSNKTRSHTVSYAIRPYPVANQPAPVFAQGDVDDVFDIILIPDTDITDMDDFRDNCHNMIRNTIHREPSMNLLNHQFNFYINPLTGTATDYDRISVDGHHLLPANTVEMSFAEVRVLMHQNNLRDYSWNGIYSTEMDRPQTFIHEGGHGMFGLADEYSAGAHWQAADLPNNWASLAAAQADAPGRNKTAADARQIGTSGWYKLCTDNCPMISGSALLFDYDTPCEQRVIFEIIQNAIE